MSAVSNRLSARTLNLTLERCLGNIVTSTAFCKSLNRSRDAGFWDHAITTFTAKTRR
jgi:hypothetical protein